MNFRRILYSLLSFLLLLGSPVWALFCTSCGVKMADDAKFCAQCGKARTESPAPTKPAPAKPSPAPKPTPAPIVTSSPTPTPMIPPAPPSNPSEGALVSMPAQSIGVEFPDDLLKRYDEINRFEAYLLASTYYRSMSQTNQFRRRIADDLQQADALVGSASPLTRKLHDLYKKKFALLGKYHSAWGEATLGPMQGQAEARKAQAAFMLERTNDLILTLREATESNQAQVLARVDQTERQLEEATREYRVTAKYLKVGDTIVPMSHPVWIMEVQGSQAKVMYMAQSYGPEPIWGWVSLSDLVRRTTWRMEYRTVECVPTPPPTTVVVFDDRHSWPRREHYPIILRFPFPGHDSHRGDHRDDHRGETHDRGKNRGNDRDRHR